jgi:hypothetical protein
MAEITAIAVLITTCASACIGVISQIQHSRCVKLRVCFGMCECARKVPDVEEATIQLESTHLT